MKITVMKIVIWAGRGRARGGGGGGESGKSLAYGSGPAVSFGSKLCTK